MPTTKDEFIDKHKHRLMGMVYDVLKSPMTGTMYSRQLERCVSDVAKFLADTYDELIPPPTALPLPPPNPPKLSAPPKTTF